MIKINLKTKLGYRKQNINPDNLINYRQTKYGYSKKSEKIIKKIHEKIIDERAKIRYKEKIIEIRKYQQLKRIRKLEKRKLKLKELEPKELIEPEEPEELIEPEEPEEPEKLIKSYNWLCTCLVSDRIFSHIFGVSSLVGSDEEYVIREHEKYYPDHELKSIELYDMSGENQKELHEELEQRKKHITKTEGIYFYN